MVLTAHSPKNKDEDATDRFVYDCCLEEERRISPSTKASRAAWNAALAAKCADLTATQINFALTGLAESLEEYDGWALFLDSLIEETAEGIVYDGGGETLSHHGVSTWFYQV